MGGVGGFGAPFRMAGLGYRDPILVSSTDGVGTKQKPAAALDGHDTIDLVAMCVNDVVVQGAEPIYFLRLLPDRTARHRGRDAHHHRHRSGLQTGRGGAGARGDRRTSTPGDYDSPASASGWAARSSTGAGCGRATRSSGFGVAVSGPHANGYSLIRRLIEHREADLSPPLDGRTFAEALLMPTRIYVRPIVDLIGQIPVRALAHITGGGLYENLPRVMPPNTRAVIDTSAWPRPPVFDWIQDQGTIAWREMHRTFDCGIGMVAVVAEPDAARAIALLSRSRETAWRIGTVVPWPQGTRSAW